MNRNFFRSRVVTASRTQSATQSDTPSSTVAHNDAVIRVYDDADNVIETHEHAGDFKSPSGLCYRRSHAALTRSTPMEL
ncbi:MAG: hypothetical protein DME74_07770 [Verrucomicrobia bacterium]|nr:MAG: hypothetical protein DME74_07770 [Verrucomicrobiota bacterium]